MKMPGLSEQQIQAQIVAYLRQVKPPCLWFAINNNPRSARDGVRLQSMGLMAGVADLCFIWRRGTRTFPFIDFVEIKTAKGRQSEHQKTFEVLAQRAGAQYSIWRSVDDAQAALKEWGLVR